jgi:hypothetical protein
MLLRVAVYFGPQYAQLLLCSWCLSAVADLGVHDPEQLVCVHKKELAQSHGARSSSSSSNGANGSNGSHDQDSRDGSSSSTGNGTASGSASSAASSNTSSSSTAGVLQSPVSCTAAPSWVSVSSTVDSDGVSETEGSETDSSAGDDVSIGSNGAPHTKPASGSSTRSANSSGAGADKDGVAQPMGDRNSSEDSVMTSKEAEWGLLQLDLSFAWQLQDKPVQDVNKLLENAAMTKR